MKNLINYYYNLIIKEFKKSEDYFSFEINKNKYVFLRFYGDVNLLYKIYLLLNNNYKYCHEIIINKDNSVITFYENNPYVLIKKNLCSNNIITIREILDYDALVYEKNEFNWKDLWKNKIDYYEYQVNQFGFKYPIIRESFSYYIGLSELAINLLNYVNNKNINAYISHKRINYKEKMDEFTNPLNIIIDNRTRDIAEYYKINFINEKLSINEILNELSRIRLNRDEALLLLSRLLYPSYYFDMYDKIIQESMEEEKINFYIKKNVYYETFLKQIYQFLKNQYNILEIEFLEN